MPSSLLIRPVSCVLWVGLFLIVLPDLHVQNSVFPSLRSTRSPRSRVALAEAALDTSSNSESDCDFCDGDVGGTNRDSNNLKKTDSLNERYNPLQTNDIASESSRRMASIGQVMTNPVKGITLQRRSYPEAEPHICLAFLSCCNRIDLLNHTIAGVLRHMEQDEPSELRYEIAWVDNGSDDELTQPIMETYHIEHALRLPHNMGLAYGMNLLIRNLCTAPYILLLEEDWLYLDELVAPQTPERKRAVATSVALLESLEKQDVRAYDQRQILGVFLRHETYETFLTFPHADVWERHYFEADFSNSLPKATPSTSMLCEGGPKQQCEGRDLLPVDYRVFCADTGLHGDSIWGSYTNGAGLYRRRDLIRLGRMYGEPGDPFHDRYVEGNYAFRAALLFCHAAVRLTSDTTCVTIDDPNCAGAFHHIGGGRGTRPRTAQGTTCADPSWNFFGTPLYEKYLKMVALANGGKPVEVCSDEELQALRVMKFRELDAQEYREQVARDNAQVFEQENQEREKTRFQANAILNLLETGNVDMIRNQIPWMAKMTQEEIQESANRMLKLMDSPHPLRGFWDSHGRIIGGRKDNTR